MHEIARFDGRLTSVESVRKAIYRFGGGEGFSCRLIDDDIVIHALNPVSEETLALLFRHVNDYELRKIVTAQTLNIRDAVLGAALLRVAEQRDDS